MMALVRLALRRPISVAVMALLMLVLGALSFAFMNADIFPAIRLPVVMVVWNYPGLAALQIERRMVWISERAYSTTVNGIEHINSESMNGLGILKVYFYPNADIGGAIAQINAVSETILSQLPRGTVPPQIISYDAANVPVAQLNIYSDTLSEQQLFDYGLNFIRVQLFTIPGFSSPAPLGGVQRAVMVNLDPTMLYANGLSPADVGNALSAQNVVIPSGTARMGDYEYDIDLNMSPSTVSGFNRIPIKIANGAPVHLGDLAPVSDTHQPQTNVVRVNGRRSTYLLVIKHADASTLTVVNDVKKKIPVILASAIKGIKLSLTFDQSTFVRGALWEVVRESLIAAGLVALMVLIFIGSPRSTLIVITSIPLSILTAIVFLNLSGQTLNIMTLGGLALAVGMLVDDATVEIENIHRNHAMHKPLLVAILDGASQIATPTLIGTLSICIVFFPVALLSGVAKFLFTPLALAVVFAMLTSYLLSRTLVTTMAHHLLGEEHEDHSGPGKWNWFVRRFENGFNRFRERYRRALAKFIARRALALTCVSVAIIASMFLVNVAGEDFFPEIDAGMMRLHIRMPTGTRIERTEYVINQIENQIRKAIPDRELVGISDNIGLPISYDLAFYQTDSTGPQDADILIQEAPEHHPTAIYETKIRNILHRQFPNVTGYFQAADIVSQVLNFGLPAAIDTQISGNDLQSDYRIASRLAQRMKLIPGLVDVRIAEPLDYPAFQVNVDRDRALELGVTESAVASSLLTALSGNALLQPDYWLDPVSGVNYTVISQSPQHWIDSVEALKRIPIAGSSTSAAGGSTVISSLMSSSSTLPAGASITDGAAPGLIPPSQVLGNVASVVHSIDPSIIAHYNVQRVMDVNAAVSGRDLGSVTDTVQHEIEQVGKLPPGTRIAILGQSQAMRQSFGTLELGLLLAIVLVYLLMAANFQSWLEPLLIMLAVPGAMAGVIWMLVLTGTTINVESLMGAIMAVGVAVANSNLLVTFGNELREEGYGPVEAAIEAGRIRLRPILMTALAMILGMLPMALGIGEGSELNAPLGRAVIGGLIAATLMTLFVVPAVYSILSRTLKGKKERDQEIESVTLPGA
ncbi:MAG TPA: efflux RND transporter permease subunit [Candidatus Binataceae bacterium]|nr:efflux RND transporter permease subunit [Candidatus Binataceae bacterium]